MADPKNESQNQPAQTGAGAEAPVSDDETTPPQDDAGQIRASNKESALGRASDYASDYATGKAFDKAAGRLLGGSGDGGGSGGGGGSNDYAAGDKSGAGGERPSNGETRPAWQTDKVEQRADAVSKGDSRMDRLRRGQADRKSGAHVKDAFQTERRGRKLASTGGGLAGQGAKAAASEAGKDVAKAATKEVVKDVAKGAAQLGAKAIPGAGVATAIPLDQIKSTVQDTARDLKDFHILRAARRAVSGVGFAAAVTLFRASYDFYVIGLSGGLSLIVTFLLGNVLFFSSRISRFEKLIIFAVDMFLFFVLLTFVILAVYAYCQFESIAQGAGAVGVGALLGPGVGALLDIAAGLLGGGALCAAF